MNTYGQEQSEDRTLNGGVQNQAPGGGRGYRYGNVDYNELVGARSGDEGDMGHVSKSGLDGLHDEMARMKLPGFEVNELTSPPRLSAASSGSTSPTSESSGYTPQLTPTRCGSRPNLDSYSRLFGAPEQSSISRRANHMKSDIFGIEFGCGSGDDQRWDQRKMTPAPQCVVEKTGMQEGGQGDCPEYERSAHYDKQKEGQSVAPGRVTPAGAKSDAPMGNARENGGNPVTGAGYHEEERVQRRRQFAKTQFMASKFW